MPIHENRQERKCQTSGLDVQETEKDPAATTAEEAEERIEGRARALFLEGVELEQQGSVHEAITKYKRAIQLVPDIEHKAFLSTCPNTKDRKTCNTGDLETFDETGQSLISSNLREIVRRLERVSIPRQLPNDGQEQGPTKAGLADLPEEVLIKVLKWVVSSQLDLRSLEWCSEVNKHFHNAARSSDIWRLVCQRTWGCLPRGDFKPKRGWRNLYLTRPKVRFEGCYVAKMSYTRQGERSFQDNEHYRSWFLVQHYRLIKFFPGGRVVMATTADDPRVALKLMQDPSGLGIPGTLVGKFRTAGKLLVCVLEKVKDDNNNNNSSSTRARVGSASNLAGRSTQTTIKGPRGARRAASGLSAAFEVPEQVFQLDMELAESASEGRLGGSATNYPSHDLIKWVRYSILSRYKQADGMETLTEIDVKDSAQYPRLKFMPCSFYNQYGPSTEPLS